MPTAYNNILIELNKAVKTLHLYPSGHPALGAQLRNCHSLLKNAATEEGEIKWTVDQKGFYFGETPIAPAHEATAALAKQFFLRRIKVLTFMPDIAIDDIAGFLSLLSMEPEQIRSNGGAERVLAKKGVTGVLLNEMSYEELKNLQEELKEEEQETEEMVTQEDEGEAEEAVEEGREEEPPPPQPEGPPGKEETLNGLLERLKNERDTIRYNDLAVRIKEKAEAGISELLFDDVLPVLLVFHEHAQPSSGLPEELKDGAIRRLGELLSTDTINYLISRLGQREEPNRHAIEQILLTTGQEGTGLMLDALVDTREAHSRRHIYNALVNLGERVRPEVERRLGDERWFAVRQMVSLLGALGGAQSLDALETAYTHPDIRVKKEILKSLARIPSERSSRILMEALKQGDRTIQGQAIISLGMLKDPRAVDILGEIALKRDAFSDNFEQRKEAVKALGIVGSENAVPYLKRLLFKKGWFGKRANEEIRSLAVISLGKIGGDEALEAIERACNESSGALYNTCKRVLEAIR
jgi:HEAT repeat protein